jgi:two-component system sensor histidine kinase HydH
MADLRWRFFWAVCLATVCLVGLCIFTAASLFREQAKIANVLRENVASRRAAVEMEECLNNVISLEGKRIEELAPLHDRLRVHVAEMRRVSDEPEEQRLATLLESGFASYMQRWQALPAKNQRRLEDTTDEHERVLRQLAWGMAGVAGLGGIAGLVFGFGTARGLSRTIHRLQVQIRDAAGKLDPKAPEIVLTGEGRLLELHEEIDNLTTQIERVVQQLHDREREVLRAEQLAAVGQLAAGVGHEIRNPLTSIKMLAQAAIEDGQAGLTTEDLRIIESEIRRMERTLQTFLDFARPPKPERRPVNLNMIIETVIGLTRGRADKQHVTTHLELPLGGVTITADGSQIQQVLVNLVLNALDAMPSGGRLMLCVRQSSDRVELEVDDTGPGVSRDILPKLFQSFVSNKETGLGLGLVISRRIVEDHGGTIDAANRPEGGATFYVRLPAA